MAKEHVNNIELHAVGLPSTADIPTLLYSLDAISPPFLVGLSKRRPIWIAWADQEDYS